MKDLRLPAIARAVLAIIVSPAVRNAVEGDLLEAFARQRLRGRWHASRWLAAELLSADIWRLRRIRDGRQSVATPATEVGMLQDIRFAFRALARRRVYVVAITATLAIGIGANSAVFALVNSQLLRPLPLPESDRLVMLFRTVPRFGFERSTVSFPDFLDWRQAPELDDAAAYAPADRTLAGAGDVERLRGYVVTGRFFRVLRVAPALGRSLTDADDQPGATAVVVLSHGAWTSRFGGRADIIGSSIRLGDEQPVVVGVMPRSFGFPSAEAAFWLPLRGDALRLERDRNFLSVVARLAPDASLAAAQRGLTTLVARIDREAPGANEDMSIRVEERLAFTVRNVGDAIRVFQWVVVLVLALACAGVANLMLTNAVGRRRELAVRAALGASHRRLVRQVMIEAMIPGLLGGVLGLVFAAGLVHGVRVLGAGLLPRLQELSIDWRVLLVTAGTSMVAAVTCGVAPAVLARRTTLTDSLRHASPVLLRSRTARRVQDALVVSQMAIALILLIGAGLLGTSFLRLTGVRPGFDPARVVAGRVSLPPSGPDSLDATDVRAQRDAFFGELLRRVQAIPDVGAAGLTWSLPFSGHGFSTRLVPADRSDPGVGARTVDGSVVDGDYFKAMSMPLLAGRSFVDGDGRDAPAVAIISRALAEQFWPGVNAVGRRLRMGDEGNVLTVVGIVADTRQRSLAEPAVPMFYQPFSQAAWPTQMFVVARGTGAPAPLVALLRGALRQVAPTLPLTDIAVGDQLIATTVAGPRFRAAVLTILGVFAVLLAVVGMYGVVALGVAERRRELGLRRALGAADSAVIGMVVGGGLRLALIGGLIGGVAAILLGRFVASLLFGVSANDATTFAGAAAILIVVTLIASFIPARHAVRVDPSECMRVT